MLLSKVPNPKIQRQFATDYLDQLTLSNIKSIGNDVCVLIKACFNSTIPLNTELPVEILKGKITTVVKGNSFTSGVNLKFFLHLIQSLYIAQNVLRGIVISVFEFGSISGERCVFVLDS